MGQAKAEFIEVEERGWYALDTHVCADCVEDEFLKSLIKDSSDVDTCDYCRHQSGDAIAAPTEVIMKAIAAAVYYYFNDPTNAGVPWEGGASAIEPIETGDVLMSIGLDCHDDLFENIEKAFINEAWVPAAGGHWSSSHPHEELSSSWGSFVDAVKHKTRYFFTNLKSEEPGEYPPAGILKKIGELVDKLALISRLPVGMRLYRVRERGNSESWELVAKEIGPPPCEKARAGRMNPAGISYLYLAQERETALAEVLSGPPCTAACAEFLVSSEVTVIDLCQIHTLPSIFDNDLRDVREGLLFIADFAETISEPVRKDGGEHVDYVPSQVVSEFFAKVLGDKLAKGIHGMVYPSAVQPGGRNVVLFPSGETREGFDSLVEYQSGELVTYSTWRDFTDAISLGT